MTERRTNIDFEKVRQGASEDVEAWLASQNQEDKEEDADTKTANKDLNISGPRAARPSKVRVETEAELNAQFDELERQVNEQIAIMQNATTDRVDYMTARQKLESLDRQLGAFPDHPHKDRVNTLTQAELGRFGAAPRTATPDTAPVPPVAAPDVAPVAPAAPEVAPIAPLAAPDVAPVPSAAPTDAEREHARRIEAFRNVSRQLREMFTRLNESNDNGGSLDDQARILSGYETDRLIAEFNAYDDLPDYPNAVREITTLKDTFNRKRREMIEAAAATPPAPATPEIPPTTPLTVEIPPVPPTPRTPEQLAEIKSRLDFARENYLKHKDALKQAQSVKGWFKRENKDIAQIQTQLQQVEATYERVRAEYLAATSEDFMLEADRLAQAKLEMLTGEKSESKIAKWYHKLGNTGIFQNYKGPFKRTVKFLTNNRSLLNAGLIGAAIFAGPGGWVAGGALISRRLLSGLGAGFGASELAKNARRANVMKESKVYATIDQLDDRIEQIRARAGLDGTLAELAHSKVYKDAVDQRNRKVKEMFESLTPEQKADYIATYFAQQEGKLDEKIQQEEKWNRKAAWIGVAAGVFVGSGAAAGLIRRGLDGVGVPDAIKGGWGSVKNWWASNGGLPRVGMFGPLGNVEFNSGASRGPGLSVESDMRGHSNSALSAEGVGKETAGATAAAAATEAGPKLAAVTFEAGSRGFEGALLDLKGSNPALYQLMIEKLQAADPGFKGGDGGLIHRFMEKYAEENGLNIDGDGGKDLSDIFSGKGIVEADGTIKIGDYELMPERTPTVTAPDNTGVEAPEPESDEPIETQGMGDQTPAPEPQPRAPQPVQTGSVSPTEFIKQSGAAGIDMSERPTFSPEDSSDSPTPNATETGISERVLEAIGTEKNSDALKIVAGSDYKDFIKDAGLSERNLNSLGRMNYSEFVKEYNSDESFAKKYSKFMGWLAEERLNGTNEQALSKAKDLRTFLIVAAEKSK